MTISEALGACANCIKERPEDALPLAMRTHALSRTQFGLPPEPPRDPQGVKCRVCANECSIPEGGLGFCGLVENRGGLRYRVKVPDEGVLEWYYDPHPTNCVAEWFCPGATGLGYPRYAVSKGPEKGYANLAVFYGACNLDCLFCQNWHYRENARRLHPRVSAAKLAKAADEHVTCICYFGGDPSPQIVHAIRTSKLAVERAREEGRIMRICWETNGLVNRALFAQVVKLSLESGGIVKFDLKAWNQSIYKALCGVNGPAAYENLEYAAKFIEERPEVPLVMASTLLVPGYVDEEEVRAIAKFLADLNPSIPYSLLAFHPDYVMTDLPPTSRSHAERCLRAAKEEGLENVHIGNAWLLSDYY